MHCAAQQNDNYTIRGDINWAGARDMQNMPTPAAMVRYEHIRMRAQPTGRDINIHFAIMEKGVHAATPRRGKRDGGKGLRLFCRSNRLSSTPTDRSCPRCGRLARPCGRCCWSTATNDKVGGSTARVSQQAVTPKPWMWECNG